MTEQDFIEQEEEEEGGRGGGGEGKGGERRRRIHSCISSLFFILFLFLFLKTGFHHVGQAGLELPTSGNPPDLASKVLGLQA